MALVLPIGLLSQPINTLQINTKVAKSGARTIKTRSNTCLCNSFGKQMRKLARFCWSTAASYVSCSTKMTSRPFYLLPFGKGTFFNKSGRTCHDIHLVGGELGSDRTSHGSLPRTELSWFRDVKAMQRRRFCLTFLSSP